MPRVADLNKEQKFIEYFTDGSTASNATASAKKAGYTKNPSQHGYWLRKKYEKEIRSINETKITSTSSLAIDVLKDLLVNSEQDSVKLNTAKLLLELGNYSSQNINLNIDDVKSKTDEELIQELQTLVAKVPNLKTKLQFADEKNVAHDLTKSMTAIKENTKH
tara:strand:- start:2648 stop:3136 length:489 start_codon:yes stop_codon:yes gene_type:complete